MGRSLSSDPAGHSEALLTQSWAGLKSGIAFGFQVSPGGHPAWLGGASFLVCQMRGRPGFCLGCWQEALRSSRKSRGWCQRACFEPRSPLLLSGPRFLSSEKQRMMLGQAIRKTHCLAIFSASKVTTLEFNRKSDPPPHQIKLSSLSCGKICKNHSK